MRAGVLLCLAFCATAALGSRQLRQALQGRPGQGEEYFLRVDGLDFVLGCDKFYFAGWNQWEVVEAAAGAPFLSGASIPVNMTGPELVRTLMDQAVAAGLNTMRTWAHSVNPQYALQTAPGQYNEAVFRGLDYVLDEARKRGLKLILAFTSNWTPVGGIPEYLRWAGATQPLAFYTQEPVKAMYRNFVAAVLGRVNTVNGCKYSEDPTVAAWNLINEPRCKGCPAGTIANWVSEMAAFVKQQDANHLLTVGEDGFYGCCKAPANPGVKWTEWAAEEGQSFIDDHSSPHIDFASFHGWVDNWGEVSQDFLRTWVVQHVQDSADILRKPVVFEEFGKWVNETAKATMADRNTFFKFAYDLISQMEQAKTALKGAMFWQWYADGQEAPASEGGDRGLYGVYESDEAFQSVRQNAAVAKQLSTAVDGCSPAAHKSALASTPNDCAATRVNGEPGTGLEGAKCDQDINECVRGTATCSPNAACVNEQGGYKCVCHWGYDGDGKSCAPNERAIQELQSVYWSQPEGMACDAGVDVEWPSNGPGFVYDPMNSFAFFNTTGGGKYGSRTNVTLLECMEACQMSDQCESFVYNDVLEQCFLKRGQCPAANYCWEPKEGMCVSENDRGGSFSFPCGFWRSYYRLDMDTDAACGDFVPAAAGGAGRPDPANLEQFKRFASGLANAMARFNPAAEPRAATEAAAEQPSAEPSAEPVPEPATEPPGGPTEEPATEANGGSVPLLTSEGGMFPQVQLLDPTAGDLTVAASNGPSGK